METILCSCGARARKRKSRKGHYYKCTFCGKKSDTFDDAEDARKDWVSKRKLGKGKWYK